MEEKRIYVVVAETVQVEDRSIIQPCGRVAAQCAHVVSKMRLVQAAEETVVQFTPYTTIVLGARDSKEMGHIFHLLGRNNIRFEEFYDENGPVYGEGHDVLTALCTFPIEPSKLIGLTDYLPLWEHGRNLQ